MMCLYRDLWLRGVSRKIERTASIHLLYCSRSALGVVRSACASLPCPILAGRVPCVSEISDRSRVVFACASMMESQRPRTSCCAAVSRITVAADLVMLPHAASHCRPQHGFLFLARSIETLPHCPKHFLPAAALRSTYPPSYHQELLPGLN